MKGLIRKGFEYTQFAATPPQIIDDDSSKTQLMKSPSSTALRPKIFINETMETFCYFVSQEILDVLWQHNYDAWSDQTSEYL